MTREQQCTGHPETGPDFCRARILYMDDDIGLGRLLQKRLERMACMVDVAGDGTEGLEMFAKGVYDVVIADYNMPGANGLEVLQKLKDLTPVVILTGQGDEQIAVEAMKLGAADYVAKDVGGEYIRFLPSVIDRVIERQQLIRDRKQAQAELLASEARYRAIVEDQTELICRFRPAGGKLTFANAAFCRYFGIQPADIGFQNFADLLSRRTYQAMREILKTLTPQNPVVTSVQNMKTANGKVHWLHWTSRAIFDEACKLKEYQLVVRDITALKLAKAALREGKENKSALLKAIGDPIIRVDREGAFVDIQCAKDLDLNLSADLIGRNMAEFFPPEVALIMQKYLHKLFEEGSSEHFQFELRQGEKTAYCEARFVPAGKQEALTILRDVTERVKLEQELQAMRQERGLMAGEEEITANK